MKLNKPIVRIIPRSGVKKLMKPSSPIVTMSSSYTENEVQEEASLFLNLCNLFQTLSCDKNVPPVSLVVTRNKNRAPRDEEQTKLSGFKNCENIFC